MNGTDLESFQNAIASLRGWIVKRLAPTPPREGSDNTGRNPTRNSLLNIQIDCFRDLNGGGQGKQGTEPVDLFLGVAEALTKFETGAEFVKHLKTDPFKGYKSQWIDNHNPKLNTALRADELLIDHLTAAWLGLYFLGVPFVHPWERVRRFAEQSGGFPSVASLCKAVGDVFRQARQVNIRDNDIRDGKTGGEELRDEEAHKFGVIVVTRQPFALYRALIERDVPQMILPADVHVLARCYLLLQLRLYIGEGLPIKYLIPNDSVRPPYWGDESAPTDGEIHWWLNEIVFPGDRPPHQSVELIENQAIMEIGDRSCVLNAESGIFTMDRMDDQGTLEIRLPFLGGIISTKNVVDSYRTVLARVSGKQLLGCSENELSGLLSGQSTQDGEPHAAG